MPADYRRILEQVLLDRSYGEITVVVVAPPGYLLVRKGRLEHGLTTQIPVCQVKVGPACGSPDGVAVSIIWPRRSTMF